MTYLCFRNVCSHLLLDVLDEINRQQRRQEVPLLKSSFKVEFNERMQTPQLMGVYDEQGYGLAPSHPSTAPQRRNTCSHGLVPDLEYSLHAKRTINNHLPTPPSHVGGGCKAAINRCAPAADEPSMS